MGLGLRENKLPSSFDHIWFPGEMLPKIIPHRGNLASNDSNLFILLMWCQANGILIIERMKKWNIDKWTMKRKTFNIFISENNH